MMRIFHSSGSILTGSDLGEALLLYAHALTVQRQCDTVDMPFVGDLGQRAHAPVVIGYGSPVVGAPVRVAGTELVDPERLDLLCRRTGDLNARLTDVRAVR
jgi:hypothetical protein